MQKSESISKLITALIAAQLEFDPVLKDKDNPFFHSKYADLASVIAATKPALTKNGIVVSQFPVAENGRVGVLTILAHSSGEFISEAYTLPIAKQDPQTGVAAITYARRAADTGVLGIAAEDDDGNTAAGLDEINPEVPPRIPRPKRQVSEAPAEDRGSRPAPPEPEVVEEPEPVEEAPASISMPSDGPVPDKAGLDKYRETIVNLQKELVDSGGLKQSRGLTVSRKILIYLLNMTGAAQADKITVPQWDTFFGFINQIKASEGGITKLAKLIDSAAKGK